MATIIYVNGSTRELRPANGRCFTLEELQEAVGGFIEPIRLPCGDELILDEEGKIKGKSMNGRASVLLAAAGGLPDDYVAGDAVRMSAREFEETGGDAIRE